MPKLGQRIQHAWNAFRNPEKYSMSYDSYGLGYGYRPDRRRLTRGNERSIVNSVYNKIANDVAQISIKHVRVDANGRFTEVLDTGLNNCLTVEANKDQTGRQLIHDGVVSMFDEGCVAFVPTDTNINPMVSGSYDIETMRTGKVTAWYPDHVRIDLYNDISGRHQEVTLPKSMVALVENPFYMIMNEPNSTLQRLIRKLNLLDSIDEQSGAGKLDLILQLPYVIKSKTRKEEAEKRRADIERQLAGSKYGIAYTDGTERVTQLNRPVENNLMNQIQYLTSMLYSQLGITEEVFKGTADDKTTLNYYNSTIEPILSAITEEMKRKFLTKTGRTQGQSIAFFRDPFKLVPVNEVAELADKLTRNEIMSTNEMRAVMGMKPIDDPRADELRNKNLNQTPEMGNPVTTDDGYNEYGDYEDYEEEEV